MAMSSVEKRMELLGDGEEKPELVSAVERNELLLLAEQLAQPEVNDTVRLEIALRMRQVLERTHPIENGRMPWEHPPPSSVSVG